MDLESSPMAEAFGRYNDATLTTVIDEDEEGMDIRRHFAFTDGSHEDQNTSKKFNVESDFDVREFYKVNRNFMQLFSFSTKMVQAKSKVFSKENLKFILMAMKESFI